MATDPMPIFANLRRLHSTHGPLSPSGFLTSSGILLSWRSKRRLRLRQLHHIGLHGDHIHRASLRAKPAADTTRFVLEHGRAGDGPQFLRRYVVQLHVEDSAGAGDLVQDLGGEIDPVERYELNAIFRTHVDAAAAENADRKSTRLNSSHLGISYAVFCLT